MGAFFQVRVRQLEPCTRDNRLRETVRLSVRCGNVSMHKKLPKFAWDLVTYAKYSVCVHFSLNALDLEWPVTYALKVTTTIMMWVSVSIWQYTVYSQAGTTDTSRPAGSKKATQDYLEVERSGERNVDSRVQLQLDIGVPRSRCTPMARTPKIGLNLWG